MLLALPLGILASATSKASAQDMSNVRHVVFAKGKCTYKLTPVSQSFIPCNPSVVNTVYTHGRSSIHFTKEDAFFSFSGGRDRQPNLENYILQVDSVYFGMGGKEVRAPAEGECHIRLHKQGVRYREIRCEVYNRAAGMGWNFYLRNVTDTEHKSF